MRACGSYLLLPEDRCHKLQVTTPRKIQMRDIRITSVVIFFTMIKTKILLKRARSLRCCDIYQRTSGHVKFDDMDGVAVWCLLPVPVRLSFLHVRTKGKWILENRLH